MPILYTRLQAVVAAAHHYHHRYTSMLEYINAKMTLASRGHLSTRDALTDISLHINTTLPEDVSHYATIREEQALYRTHYHRRSPDEVRERERNRLRQKRHPGEFIPGAITGYLDTKHRSAAEIAAAADATDEAFAGLADLALPDAPGDIEPLSQPAILPPDQEAAYQAFRAARSRHDEDSQS